MITLTSNLDEVSLSLEALEKRGHNLAPLTAEIANLLLTDTETAFETQTAPDGKKWAPLKEATLKKSGSKMLYDQGDLQQSLHVFHDSHQAGVGLNVISNKGFAYASAHQFGTKTLPARPFLPIDLNGEISNDLKDSVLELAMDFFKDVV